MPLQANQHIAAVDLGSNSFHMIVVSVDKLGHVRVLDRLREAVRLGSGLNAKGDLTLEAQLRALACLQRFGDRIRQFPSTDVAAVGTNTMRRAHNARAFLNLAEEALGHPISVISGREEARLIYLGVAHSLGANDKPEARRLVVDIGGGSTELIIGQGYESLYTESLEMGCVTGSKRFFDDGNLTKSRWKKAMTAAKLELMPIERSYRNVGWEAVSGASGTIKAIGKVIQELKLASYDISLANMQVIQERMVEAKELSKLQLAGLSEERKPVFAGGLAILMSVFEALNIERMTVSDGALREGLVYERINRYEPSSDLRGKTVSGLQARFQLDKQHAQAVRTTALALFDACQSVWKLTPELRDLLAWAAEVHEIGLAVSHNGYHKHGAYLLENFDLMGFATEEQHWLSVLVRTHRRKIYPKLFEVFDTKRAQEALYLSVLLRLATLLHRSRSGQVTATINQVKAESDSLSLVFDGDEQQHSLLFADLDEEKKYLKEVKFKLKCSC
ncbi:exopolyphosphatase [Thiolinea disciformis]|uniref:exopolyphosphatase n=1 Tax=Thiolinea disciformis TaxID=125614 RepID=UPI0003775C18|nr:exopolyphosphatase [Thiolinea disciformis]